MNIFAITKSIGTLKQTLFDDSSFNGKSYKCYISQELIRSWFHYGKQYTYEYKIFVNSLSHPIEINGTIFDNKIKCEVDTCSACPHGIMYEIAINGKTPRGEIFEACYRWYSKYQGELQTPTIIIYSLILTSLFAKERIETLFLNCFGQFDLKEKKLKDLILMLEEIRSIFKEVKTQYDFLDLFYQQCVKNVLEVTKQKLEDYKFLPD